ncbi:MAG: hypothetical protein Kow00105_08660 [Phycisphaeraceae bacterium]
MTVQRMFSVAGVGLAGLALASAAQAQPTGGFIALLDAKNNVTDSTASVVFYDVDDLTSPMFAVHVGFEANEEEVDSITVDPTTGDVYMLAFDSGVADGVTFDTELTTGQQDGIGDLDLYRIDFQAAYNDWVTNQGMQYVTYGRGVGNALDQFNFDSQVTNPVTGGPFVMDKIGEVARSPGESGVFFDTRLEWLDQDTLIMLDASTANTGAPGTNVRVKALKRVSTSPGAATWTPGSEEGGFNFSSSLESWESVLLGEVNLDGTTRSEIVDTAIVRNQDGTMGLWIVEADNDAQGNPVGDDVAFFEITNLNGTAGNGFKELNVGAAPFATSFVLDNNPSVDPLDNTGDANRIFVDPNGNLIFVESGFADVGVGDGIDQDNDGNPGNEEWGQAAFGAHEPNVFTRQVTNLNNIDGRIDFGAWGANQALDLTGLPDDDGAGIVTDGRMSIYDPVNNVVYFYDSDDPTNGGSFDQDWYVLDLNTGTTSFIAADVDNIVSFSFGADSAEYFCLGAVCAPALDGDLDGDGFVGIADLNIVLGNWNTNVTAGSLLDGDPSGDGFVGIEDLNTVLGNWNAGTPPAGSAVPEPASLALFTIAGLSAAVRRRARA